MSSSRAMLCYSSRRRAQRGRTLIELLIAMVLSLIIVGAVGVLYDVTSRTSRVSEQLGSAEERGRLVMYFLGEPIAMAGYGNINSNNPRFQAQTFMQPHLRGCTNGRFADPAAQDFTCVPTALPGDALYIAFQAQSTSSRAPQGTQELDDCVGRNAVIVDDVPVIANEFSIALTATNVPQLNCVGLAAGGAQALVRNVEDFKVYFALDEDNYNRALGNVHTLRPSALMTAAQINLLPGATEFAASAGNPWNYVVSVHVCVQLSTAEAGVTPDGTSVFTPCPQTVAEALDPSTIAPQTLADGIARRTYSQVFTLRSRGQALPGSAHL